jgi:hypothetical protein
MNRAERRRRTKEIINKRKEKIKYLSYSEEIEEGYLKNNNIMNKYGSGGTSTKTNTRKGHASYRHKGAYGKANNYSAHDQRQIDKEKDYENYE